MAAKGLKMQLRCLLVFSAAFMLFLIAMQPALGAVEAQVSEAELPEIAEEILQSAAEGSSTALQYAAADGWRNRQRMQSRFIMGLGAAAVILALTLLYRRPKVAAPPAPPLPVPPPPKAPQPPVQRRDVSGENAYCRVSPPGPAPRNFMGQQLGLRSSRCRYYIVQVAGNPVYFPSEWGLNLMCNSGCSWLAFLRGWHRWADHTSIEEEQLQASCVHGRLRRYTNA